MSDILLIDDQPYYDDMLAMEMVDAGHRMTVLEDPELACETIKEIRPEIVLLDILIRGLDGFGVIMDIHAMAEPPPIIILTSYEDFKGDPRLTKTQGYLLKDIYVDRLLEKINEVIAVHSRQ
ncbi:MAG: response regulator [Desulfatiglandales bacterium]